MSKEELAEFEKEEKILKGSKPWGEKERKIVTAIFKRARKAVPPELDAEVKANEHRLRDWMHER